MKVLVAGNKGRMGQAAEWACKHLGWDVTGFDIGGYTKDGNHTVVNLDDMKQFDCCLSCMPYHQNLEIAKQCIDEGVAYIDLGGRVDVDYAINDYAASKTLKRSVHTSAGLAPGLVNVMAETLYIALPGAHSIEMYCGGLPSWKNVNPLGYVCNWSIDGLFNEYADDCEVLKDGEITTVAGMSGESLVWFEGGTEFEAFCTSGGACHSLQLFKKRGLRNCSYKTLRYRGHLALMKWLINSLNKDELAKLVIPQEPYRDLVYVGTIAVNDKEEKYLFNIIQSSNRFSAMQRATAFSMVAAAHAMMCYPEPKIRTYEDINVPPYFDTFNKLLREDV